MKYLLFKLTKFCIPIIVISIIFDFFLNYNLSNYKGVEIGQGEIEVWNDIFQSNVNSDILIYGSSKAWVQFDVNIFQEKFNSSVYNLGTDGHGFQMQYFRHLQILKYNKLPKVIIYVIDPPSFRLQEEMYNNEQFIPFLYKKDIREFIKSYSNGFSIYDFYLPLSRYIGKTKLIKEAINISMRKKLDDESRYKGYLGQKSNWDISSLIESKKKMKYWEVKMDKYLLNKFDKFIIDCQNKKIKLIFICPPEHVMGQSFMYKRDRLLSYFNNISKEKHISFLDYSKDSICMDSTLFYNTRHLNEKGSQIFTRKLVNNPIVQNVINSRLKTL